MPRDPERITERVFKIKAPSATRRWLRLGAASERTSELNVRVASGRAHWQKTALSWSLSGGFVGDRGDLRAGASSERYAGLVQELRDGPRH